MKRLWTGLGQCFPGRWAWLGGAVGLLLGEVLVELDWVPWGQGARVFDPGEIGLMLGGWGLGLLGGAWFTRRRAKPAGRPVRTILSLLGLYLTLLALPFLVGEKREILFLYLTATSYQQGHPRRAASLGQIAAELGIRNPYLSSYRVESLIALGEKDQARLVLRRALAEAQERKDPGWDRLIYLADRLQDYEVMLTCIDQALRSQPGNTWLQEKQAEALSELGRYEEAREAYQQVVQKQPDRADLRRQWAAVLWLSHDLEKAIEQQQEAVRLTPQDGVTWLELGTLYLDKQDRGQAAQALLQALRRPLNTQDREKAARMLKACGAVEVNPTPVHTFLQKIEEGRQGDQGWVRGQVLLKKNLQPAQVRVIWIDLDTGKLLAEGKTNPKGYFHLEGPWSEHRQLQVASLGVKGYLVPPGESAPEN
jgi:tetratricopeptide (TPR) repeat protein